MTSKSLLKRIKAAPDPFFTLRTNLILMLDDLQKRARAKPTRGFTRTGIRMAAELQCDAGSVALAEYALQPEDIEEMRFALEFTNMCDAKRDELTEWLKKKP